MGKKKALVSDTSVLIDLLKADKGVLKAAAKYYDIYLPYSILEELEEFDETDAVDLGLIMYDEYPEIIVEAKSQESGLSSWDYICMEVCRVEGYICLTSDGGLRNACERQGVEVMRGFRLILNLVKAGVLSGERAKETGRKIKETNRYIKQETYAEFLRELETLLQK